MAKSLCRLMMCNGKSCPSHEFLNVAFNVKRENKILAKNPEFTVPHSLSHTLNMSHNM